ncbi:MAG: helix-turn-helix domain-containing protein [Solirubrobacteraceae bacterium]
MKITQPRPRSPRYLSQQERIRIADLRNGGVTLREIAADLGRAPSTISHRNLQNRVGVATSAGIRPIVPTLA